MEVLDDQRGLWRLVSFYGFSERSRRRDSWNFIKRLYSSSSLPWVLIGDFNDLLSLEDKRGGAAHPEWCYRGFREVVLECNLHDLYMEGYPFTWSRSKGTLNGVEERLDRALVSSSWLVSFPNARLVNLVAAMSDHSPIQLELEVQVNQFPHRSFHFENCWLREKDLHDVVAVSWADSIGQSIISRLDKCTASLVSWTKNLHYNFRKEIKVCKEMLEELRYKTDIDSVTSFNITKRRLAELLVGEKDYWKQRGKSFWLEDGDGNTQYFHARASARKKANRILRLQDDQGVFHDDVEGIRKVVRDYFLNLFAESPGVYDPVLEVVLEVAESFSALMKDAEERGLIHGVRICRSVPRVSHLFFADGSLLFFQSNNLECAVIKELLGIKSIFSYLKDKVWQRIQLWRKQPLSKAGREILVKSVGQAIPNYCMNAFLLPPSLADEIQKMLNSFWWGSGKEGSRGINWLNWDRMSMRKDTGGLGFHDLFAFNLAMLRN
ncbi:hypothetical protein PTKIN_Ptkin01aG0076500 [Pterospermum kingtungense]